MTLIGLPEVIAARQDIARQRGELDQRDAELAITERVLRSLGGEVPADISPPKPGRKRDPSGLPRQYARVLDLVGVVISRPDLLKAINAEREAPLSEGSYAALLSKMAKHGHIRRIGQNIFPAKSDDDGGADVS